MNKAKPYLYDFLSKYLDYCEESPSYLKWKVDRKTLFGYSARKGDFVKINLNNSSKSFLISLESKNYIHYRVIWCLFNKRDVPVDLVIDHVDGNRENNHPSNLQLITHAQNMQKRKVRADSQTGIKGIGFNPYLNAFIAGISSGNERRYRDFYVDDYDTKEQALEFAISWRHKMEDEMHDLSERRRVI